MVSAHAGLKVVVTGAASGIGRAGALRLAEAGAKVAGIDLSPADAPFLTITADVSDEADMIAAMAEAAESLGGIDAVVSCAGVYRGSSLAAFDFAAFDLMVSVNLKGMILAAREALKHLGPGGGKIVNVASELGYLGRAGASGYCATKGAVLALTRSWARELGPRVLVNAIAPGPVDTPLLDAGAMSPDELAVETRNPLNRIGQPHELTEAILFLTSRHTTFMTGQCVSVDGGAAMH